MLGLHHAFGAAQAEAALDEIEPVARRATAAVVGHPLDVAGVHAALQDEVLQKPTHGVVDKGRDHGGSDEGDEDSLESDVLEASSPLRLWVQASTDR